MRIYCIATGVAIRAAPPLTHTGRTMRLSHVVSMSLAVATCLAASSASARAQGVLTQDLPIKGLPTGTSITSNCPSGSVLTGLRARVGLVIDAVGIRCRPLRTDGTLGAETNGGDYAGGSGGTERIRSCPAGTVAVGQRIGVKMAIIHISIFCRTWNPATRTTSGTRTALEVVTLPNGIWDAPAEQCTSDSQPLGGIRARAGGILDAVGFTCRRPRVL